MMFLLRFLFQGLIYKYNIEFNNVRFIRKCISFRPSRMGLRWLKEQQNGFIGTTKYIYAVSISLCMRTYFRIVKPLQ